MQDNSNIQAVILAGGHCFGRCKLALNLPSCLWPIGEKTALERLINKLSSNGISKIAICSNSYEKNIRQAIRFHKDIDNIRFVEETLPVGTAGAIRDSAADSEGSIFLVMKASMLNIPDIDNLINDHIKSSSAMTVVLEPAIDGQYIPSDIYICNRQVLKYIHSQGYCDIKETLIPSMVQAGEKISISKINHSTNSFHDCKTYLEAIRTCFNDQSLRNEYFGNDTQQYIHPTAQLSSSTKICGPAVIMENAVVEKDVLIFGPAVIGENSFISSGSLIENTVIWPESKIGHNCEIKNCVIDCSTAMPANIKIEDRSIPATSKWTARRVLSKGYELVHRTHKKALETARSLESQLSHYHIKTANVIAFISLISILLWSYWNTILDMWNIWQISDEYSSGLLVPFLAAYILWTKREQIKQYQFKPCLWGLMSLLAIQALRYFGLYFMYASVERLALILTIAALVLFIFGWQVFKKNFSILLFLCLMMPLPRSIHNLVMLPLQNLATVSAVFFLETMGYAVSRQGNIIYLNNITISIAEVCNGLRMVTAFFVIIGMSVLLMKRPLWEKVIVFISSLPIALLCNSIRLTATSIFFAKFSAEKWGRIFHDFGGYAMMPLAIVVVLFELWLLAKLTYDSQNQGHSIIFRAHPT